MIFRQLYDLESGTYTYLLGDEATRHALLIDPVFERFDRDRALLRELDLELRCTLDTHVHADHVTAAWRFKDALGSRIVVARRAGAEGADVLVDEGDMVRAGGIGLVVRATPGHTNGCVTYVSDDQRLAFMLGRLDRSLDWSIAIPFTLTAVLGVQLGGLAAGRLAPERSLQAFAAGLVAVALYTGGRALAALG